MNTSYQQLPSGIGSEVKYTLQFWLLSNGKVMTEKDGLCNPFPPNCIESAHPFTPFQQNQWVELDTVGPNGPVKATFLVHSVLYKLKRQGGSLNDAGRPEYARCIAHWHTDVFVEKKALPDWLRAFHTDVSHS
ncbi:hypothetical protein H4G68_005414 [Escherichia coli]|nr:hypothetical protein [Escherichia coli]EFY6989003.1 hypothetical protein [Escherichia coli]EJB3792940.1 hypothetical protein [Escherichia coli]EKE6835532.1 hypothetical protein [Escherichia coli]